MSVGAPAPLWDKSPSSPEISMVTSISEDRSTEDDRSQLSTVLEPPHEDDPNAWVPKLLTTNELLGASADLKAPGNSTAPPRPTGRVVLEALDTGSSALGPSPPSVSSHPLSSHPSALNGRQGGLAEGNVTASGAPTGEGLEGAPLSMSVSTSKVATGTDAGSGATAAGGGAIAGGQGQQGGSSGVAGHGGGGEGDNNATADNNSPALNTGNGNGGLLRSIPAFSQGGADKGDLSSPGSQGGMSDGRSSRWEGQSSGRSYGSGDFLTTDGFPEGHNRERAQRHWRVLRVVLMALGERAVEGLYEAFLW